jgi:membrane-bound metal-dependent hydrolase YbcI (DUF457 family)
MPMPGGDVGCSTLARGFLQVPLPLGHMTIGFAAYEISSNNTAFPWWKTVVLVGILANLPDVDVLIGLLFRGNGWAFHRGPTHSLVFALLMACFASRIWKVWSSVPRISFLSCFFVILSHVILDSLIGSSAVPVFWPFEISWATGHIGWGGVVSSVFLDSFSEADILMVGGLAVILIRLIKIHPENLRSAQRVLSRLNGSFPK